MNCALPSPSIVLLVEPPELYQPGLAVALEVEGYTVWRATSGADARKVVMESRRAGTAAHVMVIQQALPDVDGRVLATFLRANSNTPIVLCGPTSHSVSRAVLYNVGIDAFLPSPTDTLELHALLQALLRRRATAGGATQHDVPSLSVGPLQIHEHRRSVSVANQPLALTPIQYKLLLSLARRPNNLVPIHELTESVWNCPPDIGTSALIATQMARLRAKLRDNSEASVSIVSVPSRGYRLLAA